MILSDWLKYLESLPSGLNNNSLDNAKIVASKLELLDFDGKIIAIAGTNGKGSCVTFLDSILRASGLTTVSYFSPHLIHYNERIRLNGVEVDDETLCRAFTAVKQAAGDTVLSYFEFTTLAALFVFKGQDPDIIILEAGIGGRLDAVNILDADISIITTVSLDHTKILGETRDAIGYEKSGIMRPSRPVICGANMPKSVVDYAASIKADLYCLDKEFKYECKDNYWRWQFERNIISLPRGLPRGQSNGGIAKGGEAQFSHLGQVRGYTSCAVKKLILENLPQVSLPIQSAALAIMAAQLLSNDFRISSQAIVMGLSNAFLPGRFQKIEFAGKEIIFDVAHNYESASLLALNLQKIGIEGRVLAVVSTLEDKDISAILKPLAGIVGHWYLGEVNGSRKASNAAVAQALQELGVDNVSLCSTVDESLQQAIAQCQEKDRIAVFGSFRTVAEGLKHVYNSRSRKVESSLKR